MERIRFARIDEYGKPYFVEKTVTEGVVFVGDKCLMVELDNGEEISVQEAVDRGIIK